MVVQEQVLAEVTAAIGDLAAAIDRLQALGDATDFAALGPDGLIAAMRGFETQRNRMPSVDHAFVEAARAEQLQEQTTARGIAGAFAQILHLSTGEAKARVRAADRFGPRVSLDGQELDPALPVVAAVQRAGEVTPGQAAVIGACIDELTSSGDLPRADIESSERFLVEHAAVFGPRDLQRIAVRLVDTLVPDGTEPRDDLIKARRGLTIGAQRRDGSASINGTLTPDLRAQLWAVLSSLAAPQPAKHGADHGSSTENGETGGGPGAETENGGGAGAAGGQRDTRSTAQRHHDALAQACGMLLRSGGLPRSGGVPATVLITTTLQDVQAAAEYARGDADPADPSSSAGPSSPAGPTGMTGTTGTAGQHPGAQSGQTGQWSRGASAPPVFHTADGMRLSLAQFLDIACEADVIPVFMNSRGGITAYGTSRRYASAGQVKALIARDGGCTFPGCDAPPQWCQAHHVIPWIAGGPTDISNLALVCGADHRRFEGRGWDCRMIGEIPHWIPPAWIDPEQRPLRNYTHHRDRYPQIQLPLPADSTGADPRTPSGPSGGPDVAACLDADSVKATRVSARLPPTPERIERALDFILEHDLHLENAVNNALSSWVETALTQAMPVLALQIPEEQLDSETEAEQADDQAHRSFGKSAQDLRPEE